MNVNTKIRHDRNTIAKRSMMRLCFATRTDSGAKSPPVYSRGSGGPMFADAPTPYTPCKREGIHLW